MKLMLDIDIPSPLQKITYHDSIFLIGSCFTEHIGRRLQELKFPVLQNPNGILFDPISVCYSLHTYADNKKYEKHDLFYLNELWQSWHYHSLFSGTDSDLVLKKINESQQEAHTQLRKATWLIITLGSSFSYQLQANGTAVANCHRAPAPWFKKNMITAGETANRMQDIIQKLKHFNPALQIIFTISPVRHIRDGVVENNRSKARLIEAVHLLTEAFGHVFYFPAYELVIDVLRDYRFYDTDLVHPNYAATDIVFERFEKSYIDESIQPAMEEIKRVMNAYRHRPFHADTAAHKAFLQSSLHRLLELQMKMPQLDFNKEAAFFGG